MVLAVRQGLIKKIFYLLMSILKRFVCHYNSYGLTTVQTIVVWIHKNFTQNFREKANLCRH